MTARQERYAAVLSKAILVVGPKQVLLNGLVSQVAALISRYQPSLREPPAGAKLDTYLDQIELGVYV